MNIIPHPVLLLARAFDAALTRASQTEISDDFSRGALAALLALAEQARADDPRLTRLRKRLRAAQAKFARENA